MKNMGISQLRMAATEPLNEEILLSRAVHASDIWENAMFFDTLAEASADCSLLVGTTRRRGRSRKNVTMPPRKLAEWLKKRPAPGPIGIVFGNERTGLEEADLNLCNIASHIPASEGFPSLNLSHAVQIYTYELFLALGAEHSCKGEWTAMDITKVDNLVGSITDTLADIGFYKLPGREMQHGFLRDMICRAGLSESEGKYLKNIFVKAAKRII
jgi:tRNA/rRNA methyltransferase/tRNA (cytidine32/uridine32-2'-O)-methyltransferase